MCKAIEDMRTEAAAQAAWQKAAETAMKMIVRGRDSLEEIAEITGLTLEEVQALAQEIQESV